MPDLEGCAEYIKVGDLFYKEGITARQLGEQLAHRLRESQWLTSLTPRTELIHQYVEELPSVRSEAEFSHIWNSIMDEADYFRVKLDAISA